MEDRSLTTLTHDKYNERKKRFTNTPTCKDDQKQETDARFCGCIRTLFPLLLTKCAVVRCCCYLRTKHHQQIGSGRPQAFPSPTKVSPPSQPTGNNRHMHEVNPSWNLYELFLFQIHKTNRLKSNTI